jgi:hypothetical protein
MQRTFLKTPPTLKPDKKEDLRKKIKMFVEQKYTAPPSGRISSLIKYFAIPKGVVDGVVQDWRIVFHAGANQLNDCVWAPSFSLPTVNSLLCIVEDDSFMEDWDVGKMFLNFQLYPNTKKYAAVDLGPLNFTTEECSHRWMCWTRNLMGFRPSPYNSIRMYLIAEEIIRGDQHDPDNAFQWGYILLNLPGTREYKPSMAWASKRRTDNSLATNHVCFVNNLRITAKGQERVAEAGHTISTRKSYLGLQDALRKLRSSGGTRQPGSWAGAAVYIKEDLGVVMFTSQEKWDCMKAFIVEHFPGTVMEFTACSLPPPLAFTFDLLPKSDDVVLFNFIYLHMSKSLFIYLPLL